MDIEEELFTEDRIDIRIKQEIITLYLGNGCIGFLIDYLGRILECELARIYLSDNLIRSYAMCNYVRFGIGTIVEKRVSIDIKY